MISGIEDEERRETDVIAVGKTPQKGSKEKPRKTSKNEDDAIISDRPPKRKRGLKPRSQRNRKRARGGVGIHFGTTDDENMNSTIVESEIVALDHFLSDENVKPSAEDEKGDEGNFDKKKKRIRVVKPYPYTFATFAKGRWLNRPILDVYNEEFGSYPKVRIYAYSKQNFELSYTLSLTSYYIKCYYESAIKEGRILVSGKQVQHDYKIKGGDELSHIVHRHEPAGV